MPKMNIPLEAEGDTKLLGQADQRLAGVGDAEGNRGAFDERRQRTEMFEALGIAAGRAFKAEHTVVGSDHSIVDHVVDLVSTCALFPGPAPVIAHDARDGVVGDGSEVMDERLGEANPFVRAPEAAGEISPVRVHQKGVDTLRRRMFIQQTKGRLCRTSGNQQNVFAAVARCRGENVANVFAGHLISFRQPQISKKDAIGLVLPRRSRIANHAHSHVRCIHDVVLPKLCL